MFLKLRRFFLKIWITVLRNIRLSRSLIFGMIFKIQTYHFFFKTCNRLIFFSYLERFSANRMRFRKSIKYFLKPSNFYKNLSFFRKTCNILKSFRKSTIIRFSKNHFTHFKKSESYLECFRKLPIIIIFRRCRKFFCLNI